MSKISTTDLIALVRAGVESGTIKGEVEWHCEYHEARGGKAKCRWGMVQGDPGDCRMVQRLVIPVSDGGEDRP